MRRLVWIFVVLVFIAFAAAFAGFLLARGGARTLGGPVILAWHLDGALPERPPGDMLRFPGLDLTADSSFASVFRALRSARTDANVAGMTVTLGDPRFGLAKAQEVRRQLEFLRTAGRSVDCFLETAGEGSNGTLDYYLATACDSITLSPAGEINLLGLWADGLFLRGTLDKLKIEPIFRHVGEFKSAAESFTEKGHSPAARVALDAVLDGYFRRLVEDIAARRGLEPAAVLELFDRAPLSAQTALEAGLVDSLAYEDEFETRMEEKHSAARWVDLEDYRSASAPLFPRGGAPRIAVLFAEGAILRGGSAIEPWTEEVVLGSSDFSATVDELREDDSVAAVVLRVDSPGGSALASDLILRAVTRLAAEKPVVASFADVAASGGYYIAARANKIVAEASSLTGSIGVIAGKFATAQFEEEKLGVTRDPLSRGRNAGIYASNRGFTPEQDVAFQVQMREIYDRFIAHVAAGREMSVDRVDEIGRGRVWTGEDALRLGLVDELGGLDRAIELAEELADITPGGSSRLVFLPRPRSVLDQLLRAGRSEAAGALFGPAGPPRLLVESLRASRRAQLSPGPRLELDPDVANQLLPDRFGGLAQGGS